MVTGDSGCEAYTAIAWGVGLSHERSDVAGVEGFHSLEGNMCGTVMRGADALPGSKATSRAKGSHRKLGDLGSDRNGAAAASKTEPNRLPIADFDGSDFASLGVLDLLPRNENPSSPPPEALDTSFVCGDRLRPYN